MAAHTEHYRFRDELVQRLQRDVMGPAGGAEEVLPEPPGTAYLIGVLFPRTGNTDEAREAARIEAEERDLDETAEGSDGTEDAPQSAVVQANVQRPTSMGLSFAASPELVSEVTVTVTTAVYEPIDEDERSVTAQRSAPRSIEESAVRWRRRPLGPWSFTVPLTGENGRGGIRDHCHPVEDGLELRVRVRGPRSQGGGPEAAAITATLVNRNRVTPGEMHDVESFFQSVIEVSCPEGVAGLVERPVPAGSQEDEVRLNRLLHRHVPAFAVGHGCAADWDWIPPPPGDAELLSGRPPRVSTVRTAYVPTAEVLLTDSNPDIDDSALEMIDLARAPNEEVLAGLQRLADGYRSWIREREAEAELLEVTEYGVAARQQIEHCSLAYERMAAGIAFLRGDVQAMTAFRHANEVMAWQRARTDAMKQGEGARPEPRGHRWRPFQLAFLLLTLNGIADPGHPDRGCADLLWFPTGGGKTEAYLGIIAFTTFLRRLRRGVEGGGVTALMRYTLRLLTLQQFQRAATLLCAMEDLRRRHAKDLGQEPMSLGMWVGQAGTPNTLAEATKSLDELSKGKDLQERNPVQLRQCPWCGSPMSHADYEVHTDEGRMRIRCPSAECEFHSGLPVHMVDEEIYRVRPTLIIATVDKYAQIAWREEVAALFNRDTDDGTPPPELIIQDELHLISGPLGSLTGLYETAIDLAADEPKIIASTATIRRARDQGRALFDREVHQFPPAGLDARDSWFAVERPSEAKAARRYVGLLSPNTSQASLLIRTYAALLHHAATIPGEDAIRDPYWTLVGYFNSLRLLASAELQLQDDVRDRLQRLAEMHDSDAQGTGPHVRDTEPHAELTSRVPSSEIPERLKALDFALPKEETLAAVLATNMISVGVDIDRLGLMAIMGQPQTTAEYIQSSSRVGRRHPGLVAVMFNAARSRDRSHYESFRSYHAALYREVEATSVTPFSSRTRDRGLHAVLIGLARLLEPAARDEHAAADVASFAGRLEEIADMIAARVEAITPEETEATEKELREIIDVWQDRAAGESDLRYWSFGAEASHVLMRSHSEAKPPEEFPTLTSLRDVDVEADLYLERK